MVIYEAESIYQTGYYPVGYMLKNWELIHILEESIMLNMFRISVFTLMVLLINIFSRLQSKGICWEDSKSLIIKPVMMP